MLKKTVIFICIFMLCFAAWGMTGGDVGTGAAQLSVASTVAVNDPADRSSVTYSFDSKTGTLTVSGRGDMPSERLRLCMRE